MVCRLSDGKGYCDLCVCVCVLGWYLASVMLWILQTIYIDAVTLIMCICLFIFFSKTIFGIVFILLLFFSFVFCEFVALYWETDSQVCAAQSGLTDWLILRLVLVKATVVEWVRVKKIALLCLFCIGSWCAERERERGRWLMSPMNSLINYMLTLIKSPCRSQNNKLHNGKNITALLPSVWL